MAHLRRPKRFFLWTFVVAAALLGAALWLWAGWAPLWAALVSINLAAYALWAWDKFQARRGGGRVPELCLHAMAALGATPASFLAMLSLRHKIRKPVFWALYVALTVAQIAAIFYFEGLRAP